MCGIAGYYDLNGRAVDLQCVWQATNVMRHRGPDGEGYLLLNTTEGHHSLRNGPDTPANIPHPALSVPVEFDADLVLAHRRLAIIDLSPSGHEPMTVVGGGYWLSFNGEIYNYLELRDELRSLGYAFQTECDAEVLIQAYRAWGIDCLQRFIGMFAFALWDQPQRRLWCVRDRLGIKPFYYVAAPEYFTFASEIKAFQILAPSACRPDMNQLFWFLRYGSIYNAPRTFLEGVQELPGGHYLIVENGHIGNPVRWWDVDLERARATYNYEDPEGEFLRLMSDSVRLRLRSDVPVGTCLSGGLDSSTIVALATQQLNGGRMNSFSSVYPVKGLNEERFVDLAAQQFNTIQHKVTPSPENFLSLLKNITWHQDIPTGGASVYTQNFVMKLAQGNVTVLLDGQGGDELFAGYLSYVVFYLRDLRSRNPQRWLKEQTQFLLNVYPRFNSALSFREFVSRVYRFARFGPGHMRVLQPEYQAMGEQRQQEMLPVSLHSSDALNNRLYQSIIRDTIPSLLHYEDRNSMAYSIEARVPFLDHRLVEFALGIPAELKLRGAETKGVMRRAVRGLLPDDIVDRKDKLGYPTPFSQWLRGSARTEIEAFLFDAALKRTFYDKAAVRILWNNHQRGAQDASFILYNMITAEQWLQHYE